MNFIAHSNFLNSLIKCFISYISRLLFRFHSNYLHSFFISYTILMFHAPHYFHFNSVSAFEYSKKAVFFFVNSQDKKGNCWDFT